MKLYNKNTGKIENVTTITIGNANMYVNKLSDEQLNASEYCKVVYNSKPSRKYYTMTENTELVDNQYIVNYTSIPLALNSVKDKMLAKVKDEQTKELAKIDWYWLREQKIGTEVPQEVQDLATSLYADAQTKEDEINALDSIEAIIEYEG